MRVESDATYRSLVAELRTTNDQLALVAHAYTDRTATLRRSGAGRNLALAEHSFHSAAQRARDRSRARQELSLPHQAR